MSHIISFNIACACLNSLCLARKGTTTAPESTILEMLMLPDILFLVNLHVLTAFMYAYSYTRTHTNTKLYTHTHTHTHSNTHTHTHTQARAHAIEWHELTADVAAIAMSYER